MRDIKFRGFDKENACWRYGWYTRLQDGARKYNAIIVDEDGTLVRYYIHREETIGQFTGLHDKNGKEIYEGDIVDISDSWLDASGPAGYDAPIVAVKCGATGFDPFNNYDCGCGVYHSSSDAVIIGNIHENHELLEQEK